MSAQEVLAFGLTRKCEGLIILGHPGAGKTSLTKYFLLCFATNTAQERLG